MKASFIKTLWIMLRTGLLVGDTCVKAISGTLFGRTLSRERIDNVLRTWGTKMLKVLQVSVEVHNPHQVDFEKPGRYIIMSNHMSLYDIPITYHALPGSIRMIAKKELFRIPLFGRAMRAAEIPSIDRQNREQAIKDLKDASRRLDSGLTIWVAPEGTRSHDGKLGRLKKGGFIMAIKSKATIIPVVIKGANKILPARTWQFHLNQHVDLSIGKPVDASKFGIENKEQLIAEVEQQMQTMLGDK